MSDKLQSGVPEGTPGENSWQLPASPFEEFCAKPQDAASPNAAPQAAMPPDTSFLSSPPVFQPSSQAGAVKKPKPIRWDSVATPQIGRQHSWPAWQELGQAENEPDKEEYAAREDDVLPEGPEIEIPSAAGTELCSKVPAEAEAASAAEQMLQELDQLPMEARVHKFSSLLDYDAEYDDAAAEDSEEDYEDGSTNDGLASGGFPQWPPRGISEKAMYRALNMRGLLKDLRAETDVDESPENAGCTMKASEPASEPYAGPDSVTAGLLSEIEAFETHPAALAPDAPHCSENGTPDAQGSEAQEERFAVKKGVRVKLPWRKRGVECETPAPRARDGKPWKLKRLWKKALGFALPLLAVIVIFQFIGFAVIDGASMTPSLSEHDFLIYWKFPGQIERGEVLLSRSAGYNNQILAKRVIGLPGDVVEVDDEGHVLLNGEAYHETTAIYGPAELASDVNFPIRVEEGEYFVLGDNRAVSLDSRQSAIGQIDREDIVGEVICWFHIE